MEVHLTSDQEQEAVIKAVIADGRYATREEAMKQALLLWEKKRAEACGDCCRHC